LDGLTPHLCKFLNYHWNKPVNDHPFCNAFPWHNNEETNLWVGVTTSVKDDLEYMVVSKSSTLTHPLAWLTEHDTLIQNLCLSPLEGETLISEDFGNYFVPSQNDKDEIGSSVKRHMITNDFKNFLGTIHTKTLFEMFAAKRFGFYWVYDKNNPVYIFNKNWDFQQIWYILKPLFLLILSGNKRNLMENRSKTTRRPDHPYAGGNQSLTSLCTTGGILQVESLCGSSHSPYGVLTLPTLKIRRVTVLLQVSTSMRLY